MFPWKFLLLQKLHFPKEKPFQLNIPNQLDSDFHNLELHKCFITETLHVICACMSGINQQKAEKKKGIIKYCNWVGSPYAGFALGFALMM